MVASNPPDLILLDLQLRNRHGGDLIPEIRKLKTKARILVVTVESSPAVMEEMLDRGAHGFISKGAGIEELLVAIETVLGGEIYRSPAIRKIPWQRPVPSADGLVGSFDPTRLTIWKLMGRGFNAPEIARTSGIPVSTVYYHRKQMRKLMKIRSERGLDRAAMEWAIQHTEDRGGRTRA